MPSRFKREMTALGIKWVHNDVGFELSNHVLVLV